MRVHVVDDDPHVRDSLGLLLQALGHAVEVFVSGDAYLEAGPGDGDDVVVLLDVRMPGRDGIATLEALRARAPRLPVVMMSGHGDIPLAVKAMRLGADDFVEKPFEAARITAAMERARARADVPDTLARLTPREREIAVRLADGAPNKIVAFELGISPRTVETHRARLMDKLDIRSLPELVRLVMAAAPDG